MSWVGDTMLGSAHHPAPGDGSALFEAVAPLLRDVDIATGNLEGVLTDATTSKCGAEASSSCFAFRAPPAMSDTLADAGFDVLNLANNHAWDYGLEGQADTISALDDASVGWTGTPDRIHVVRREGIRVGFVGFAPYPWAPSMHDVVRAQDLVRDAQSQAHIVVAFMHAGAEGRDATRTPVGPELSYGEDRGDTRAFAHALVDAGADLVLGSGPHVVRGMERYRERMIAYSLGNFAGWHNFSGGGTYDLSAILNVELDVRGELVRARWTSLRLAAPGIPRVDPDHVSAALARDVSRQDFGAAAFRMGRRGQIAIPATD